MREPALIHVLAMSKVIDEKAYSLLDDGLGSLMEGRYA